MNEDSEYKRTEAWVREKFPGLSEDEVKGKARRYHRLDQDSEYKEIEAKVREAFPEFTEEQVKRRARFYHRMSM